MSYLHRLVFIVMALLVSSLCATSAHALVPKTFQFKVNNYYGDQAGWHFSASAACTAAGDVYRAYGPSQADAVTIFTDSGNCGLAHAGYEWGWIYIDRISCPANSHESSLTCACDAGFEEGADGLSCVKPKEEDPCELLADMCTGSKGMSKGFSMDGKKAGISFTCMAPFSVGTANPLPGCNKGCMAQVGGFTTSMQSDAGNWVTAGTASYVGSTCDPSTINDLNAEADAGYEPEENPKTTNESDPSCTNGFKGEVNGIIVCVPPKASSGVTELEEKDNGDGTKTKSKTEVKCDNGKCEITKSSTTTNTTNNTTVSSSSTTTTVDKAAYCAQNKTAGVCKDEQGDEEGKGKFGGSCDAGFECKGDAVMCAIAKEQHKRACDTLEPVKDENSLWKKIEAGTDGESAKAMQARAAEINITTQLDKTGFGWPRSCPVDTRIDLMFVNGTFDIPFSKICPPLNIFSYIALAITALSLLVWLVFAGREKAGS